jgi:hypothetical protein
MGNKISPKSLAYFGNKYTVHKLGNKYLPPSKITDKYEVPTPINIMSEDLAKSVIRR